MKKALLIIKNIFFLLMPSIVAMSYSSVKNKEWGWFSKVLSGQEGLVN